MNRMKSSPLMEQKTVHAYTGRKVAYSQVLHSLYGSEYVFYSDHIPYQNMA